MKISYCSPLAPIALSVTVILSACGGGGGGGSGASVPSSATLAPVTQANYQTVAAVVVDPLGELANLNNVTGMIVGGVEINEAPVSLVSASTELFKRFRGKNSNLVAGVSYTEACSGGGSATVDETIASDERVTAGDRVSMTLNNCKESGMPVLNGRANFTVAAVSGDPVNSNRYSVTLAGAFDNFTFTDGSNRIAMSGDLNVTASQAGTSTVSVRLSGQSLAFSVAAGTTTSSYALTSYDLKGTESSNSISLAGQYTLTGSSGKLNGAYGYTVDTLQPIVVSASSGTLSSGALVVRGSQGTVTMTVVNGTSVRLDFSAGGDGVVTASNTLSWSAFDALN